MNGKYFVGKRVSSFERFNPESPVTGVRLLMDEENGYEAGDMDGNVWEMSNPYATQDMADNILSALSGNIYNGFEATAAPLGPEAELGDGVTVNGLYSVLAYQNITFGPGHTSDIAAPGDDEPEEEYKYVTQKQREETRKLAQVYSRITKTATEIRAEIVDEVEGLTSSFDLKLSGLSAQFEDEMAGLSSEFSAGLDGLSYRLEQVATDAAEDLAEYAEQITKLTDNLQAQIDGSITTWFYDYEPTANNEPASLWDTDDEKMKHLGDVFYIVDNAEKGGQAYRWEYVGGEYRWSLIEDVEVAKALADAANAQDTADKKRRVFTSQPTPPYDVGDLWSQGPTGELMRCTTARSSGAYVAGDWERASKYTDDSALNTFLTGQYKTDIDNIKTQADQKAETWYQDGNPADAWTTDTLKAEHKGDMWYCTDSQDATHYQKFWRWSGSAWEEMTTTPPEEVFDQIDGKAQIFITTPKPPYRKGDLWFDSATSDIMTCVEERLTGDYSSGDWEKRNKYTDDTTANAAISRTVELAADLEKITARVTSTETTTGDLSKSAIISSVEQFYQSNSATALTGGQWTDQQPGWVQGKYIWTRRLITYGDKHQAYSPSETGVCITGNTGAAGTPGTPGSPGQNGVGVSEIEPEYYLSTSAGSTVGGTWGTTVPEVKDGTYLWTRDKITYTDGNVEYTKAWNMTTPMLGSINSVVERVSELEIADENITARVESTEKSITALDEKTAQLELRDDSITAEVRETRTTVEDILYCTGRNYILNSDTTYVMNANRLTYTLHLSEPLKVGNHYAFSVWYTGSSAGSGASPSLDIQDSAGNVFQTWRIPRTPAQRQLKASLVITTASSSADLSSLVLQMTITAKPPDDRITINRVKLEDGDYSTDWSPAPEDGAEWTPTTTIVEKFTKLTQTVEGFTFEDEDGKVWINNGSINLTGTITFEDFDEDTQKRVGDGVTQEIVHTLIKDDLVQSPRIEGADIYGGAYHDSKGLGIMELTWSGAKDYPSLMFRSTSTDFPIFNVIYAEEEILGSMYYVAIMALGGRTILSTNNQDSTIVAAGNWKFSGTVSGISALSLGDEAEAPAQESGDAPMGGPEFEGAVNQETPAAKVDIAQSGGELKISLPGGTDWYLGPDGWHK